MTVSVTLRVFLVLTAPMAGYPEPVVWFAGFVIAALIPAPAPGGGTRRRTAVRRFTGTDPGPERRS